MIPRIKMRLNTQPYIWCGFAIGLMLFAATLYLHGFRGRLPYYLDPDEPVFYISTAEIKSTGRVQLNPLYPPLRFYEMVLEQTVVDVVTGGPTTFTVYAIFGRAWSAYFALLFLAVIFRIGRELHSPLAGLLTVGLLTFDAQIVNFSHVARGDTLSWALSAGVIAGTFRILKQDAKAAWIVTLLCSLGAFLAKYSAAPIWLLPAYVGLVKLFPKTHIRRLIIVAGVAAVIGFVIITRAYTEVWSYTFTKTGFSFLLSPSFDPLLNLQSSVSAVINGMGTGWSLVGASLLFTLMATWQRFAPAHKTLLALLLATVIGTAAVFTLTTARYHDAYTVVIIWVIFGGLSLGLFAERGKIPGLLAATGVVGVLAWPRAVAAWEFGEAYTTPHSLATLGDWFIVHVPQGGRVVVELSTPFNSYAGFPGRKVYHSYTVDSIFQDTVHAYRERGYEYLIWSSKGMHDSQHGNPVSLSAQPYFANATEVLRLTGDQYRGPDIVIFRLKPIQQHVLYAWFTPAISFRGYDLNKDAFKPGDQVELMLYWMSAEKIENNYIVFVHVLDPNTGKLVAGQDGPPDYGNTPTWKWEGDMQFIRDQRIFTIPANALPGIYTLRIGMYDSDTNARVQVLDLRSQPVGDGLVLQEIEIKQP